MDTFAETNRVSYDEYMQHARYLALFTKYLLLHVLIVLKNVSPKARAFC